MNKLIAIFFALALIACGLKSYNERQLYGQWYSTDWHVDGEPTSMRAWIAFDEDNTYRALFDGRKEQGEFWVDGYKLFGQAKGEDKIVVKIESLEGDELVIGINRGGVKEKIFMGRATVNKIGGEVDEEQ